MPVIEALCSKHSLYIKKFFANFAITPLQLTDTMHFKCDSR